MSVPDEQVIADRLDLEMLERPHLWPHERLGYPAVFVKRGIDRSQFGGYRETGPCMKVKDEWVVVGHDWSQDCKKETYIYASAEAVVAAGWIVD